MSASGGTTRPVSPERRLDPLLHGRAVTYEEFAQEHSLASRPIGPSYWNSLDGTIPVRLSHVISGELLCTIAAAKCWTAATLKEKIGEKLMIPLSEQVLLHGSEELEDEQLLAEFGQSFSFYRLTETREAPQRPPPVGVPLPGYGRWLVMESRGSKSRPGSRYYFNATTKESQTAHPGTPETEAVGGSAPWQRQVRRRAEGEDNAVQDGVAQHMTSQEEAEADFWDGLSAKADKPV